MSTTIAAFIAAAFCTAVALLCFILWQRAKARADHLQLSAEKAEAERVQALTDWEDEHTARVEAETAARLAEQQLRLMREEMANWEKTKAQHLEAAKASLLQAGSELSNKLLADHKREAEAARIENTKRVKETTEELLKDHKVISESMQSLYDQVKDSRATIETVQRALLSPSGAGQLAEITLENILRASGLIRDKDYTIQHHISTTEGSNLRPDAVVYLPGAAALAIDCKASKHFMALGEAEDGSEEEKAALQNLRRTMQQHLHDLAKRDYANALAEQYSKTRQHPLENAYTLMFLPSETALEKLYIADPQFQERAVKQNILPAGPSGLVHVLMQSRLLIAHAQQEENAKQILEEVKKLMASIGRMYDLSS
ncbi:MAG: DNA recombination protein RmuC, partial [Rickettsiales bacterium]|nr:DNA recombination protein RmuC [Rickettsiales bacterium]